MVLVFTMGSSTPSMSTQLPAGTLFTSTVYLGVTSKGNNKIKLNDAVKASDNRGGGNFAFGLCLPQACTLHYTRFCTPSGVSRLVFRHPPPLTCAVDHSAAFAVNAALVASQ